MYDSFRDPPPLALKIARLRAGLSQRELADRVGVSAHTISVYERGVTPPEETQAKLAEALAVEAVAIWPEREAA